MTTTSCQELSAAFVGLQVESSGLCIELSDRLAKLSTSSVARALPALERRLRRYEEDCEWVLIEEAVWPTHANLFTRSVDLIDDATLNVFDMALNALTQLGKYAQCRDHAQRIISRLRLLEKHCVKVSIYNIVQLYSDAVNKLDAWAGTEQVFRWLYEENQLTEGPVDYKTIRAGTALLNCLSMVTPGSAEAHEFASVMRAATSDRPADSLRVITLECSGVIYVAHCEWHNAARHLENAMRVAALLSVHFGAVWFYSTKALLGQALLYSGDPFNALPELEEAFAHIGDFVDYDRRWATTLPKLIAAARKG